MYNLANQNVIIYSASFGSKVAHNSFARWALTRSWIVYVPIFGAVQLYSYLVHTSRGNNSSFVFGSFFSLFIAINFMEFWFFLYLFSSVVVVLHIIVEMSAVRVLFKMPCVIDWTVLCANELTMRGPSSSYFFALLGWAATVDALMCCRNAILRCFMSQPVIINNHRWLLSLEKRMETD